MRYPRSWMLLAVALLLPCKAFSADAETAAAVRVATFRCDVTPPLGQTLIAGDKIATVEYPLLAKGIVLEAGADRYVLCAVDLCELTNGTHEALRQRLAAAAGTDAARVAVQCVHQHTAPLVDVDAQRLLAEVGAGDLLMDAKLWEEISGRLSAAVKDSLARFEPVDRIGTGQAKVDRVAATRRVTAADGKIRVRYSTCKDADLRAEPEGAIDPYLKTLTLARGEKPLVRLHYYATHPQTRYGDGRASSDFPGIARERLEKKENVFQVYFTGCGGDVTVGKYNDGSDRCRDELAERLLAGMEASVAATKLVPLGPIRWRTYALRLTPRTDAGHALADCEARLKDPKTAPSTRAYLGAMRVVFLQRKDRPIELSCLEIGDVRVLHLPGEPMLAFQQYAQQRQPAAFVAVAGYGDCGPGYLCTEQAFREGGYEPTASAVVPESEAALKKAIDALLGPNAAVSAVAAEDNPIRVLKDLPYRAEAKTDYERERCKLDLYLPAAGKDFATLVWFHGGALQAGDKADNIAAALARRFAADGVAVASVNYRLSPKVHYPAYIEDAAAAVAYVHREIAKHGGSPQRIFVSGHSAGGYLTAMLGMDARYLARHGLKTADVAGLIPVSGQMITHSTVREERKIPRTRPLIDEAAPAYHVRADAPPFLNVAGGRDMPARAEENRYFVAAMKAAGHKDATYLEVEGRDHVTVASRTGEPDDVVAKAILEFIRRFSR